MNTTLNQKPSGRPRKFSLQEGLNAATTLFHQSGYDAVSIADICKQLNIPPTSIYAAYGSKFLLYENTLESSAKEFIESLNVEINQCLSVSEIFRLTLEFSATRFTADPTRPGSYFLDANNCTKNKNVTDLIYLHTNNLVASLASKFESINAPNHMELAKSLVTLIRALSSEFRLNNDPDALFITLEIFASAFE